MTKGSERVKAWRLANPEKYAALKLRSRDRDIARAKKWIKDNPDRYALLSYQSRLRNSEKLAAKARELAGADRAAYNARIKAYHDARPWYKAWQGARQRCNNPNSGGYAYYGAKGIQCHLTKEDCAYLWERDSAALLDTPSLDRIDPSGDYQRDNCRFIENADNCRQGGINSALKRRRANNEPGAAIEKHR